MHQQPPSLMEQLIANMQGQGVVSRHHAREAILIEYADLPMVDLPDGSKLQLLHVDLNQNLWILRNVFNPGFSVDTHYHTGCVFAVTQQGEWFYQEYPHLVNKAGSYLFEPAHSIHTLTVAKDASEPAIVWFAIYGTNVNIDAAGNVTSIVDAQTVLAYYRAACEMAGQACDKLIVIGE